jgi:uncharacterized membrane protein
MADGILFVSAFAAAVGSGLIAGTFFAFSSFVMRALGRLPPAEGMAAMQSINVVVLNPVFLGVFLGTAAVSLAAAAGAALRWGQAGAAYLLAGGALYVVGTFLVTGAFNVPLNNALATLTPSDPDAPRRWADYTARWTAWNHVRTIAALAATAAFIHALRLWA